VASVAAHVVVLSAVVRWSTARWAPRVTGAVLVLVSPLPEEQGRVLVWAAPGAGAAARGRSAPAASGTGPTPVGPASPAPDTAAPAPLTVAGGAHDTSGTGTGTRLAVGGAGRASLTPEYGNGMLWVRPMLSVPVTHRPIRLDSVVALRMREMADSIEKHPAPDPNANPYVSKPWTFRAGGKTYGIDSKGLHLGDFTIPTAVLAFLSLPQGNINQARANQALYDMRADILRAAARAQQEDDFRAAVRALRERKDKERQEERARQQGNQQPENP
jgi:hypothetical protein